MKKNILNFILIGTLLLTGVVSAYQEPSSNPPAGNVEPIVHSGSLEQKKQGDFWAKFIKAGFVALPSGFSNTLGYVVGDVLGVARNSFFTQLVLPGATSQLRIGNNGGAINTTQNLYNYVFNNKNDLETLLQNNRAPITVDLSGRGTANSSAARDAAALFSDKVGICTANTAIIAVGTPAVRFTSDYNSTKANSPNADILARQIRLKGGNPAENKVLVAVDNQGNATWGTLKFDPVYSGGGRVGACVNDPNYDPPRSGTVCGTNGTDCPPCENFNNNREQCESEFMSHCKWEFQSSGGQGSVIGMNVRVEYSNAPVQTSQAMCN